MEIKPPQDIHIQEYQYDLPEDRIAHFPLAQRDASKLLVYRAGEIEETLFSQLPEAIPASACLLFNDTRVIQARLHFQTEAGHTVEVFCLEPIAPAEYAQNFSAQQRVRWKGLIGNNRKWKNGTLRKRVDTPTGIAWLQVARIGQYHDAFEVEFTWEAPLAFAEILHHAGVIPLPPYMQRESTEEDTQRYQTVYAREKGSVAAPTAGLHFTEPILRRLEENEATIHFVTLHVGAGTFKPVQPGPLSAHHMHQEYITISRRTIEAISQAVHAGRPVIPVGTTSLRVLESLFWFAARLWEKTDDGQPFHLDIDQWEPYQEGRKLPTATEALDALLQAMNAQQHETLEGYTRLLIAPGYPFQLSTGLITNFHQPGSTLLLLIAALIGPSWKSVYQYALARDFRFLSYGDSSLLLP